MRCLLKHGINISVQNIRYVSKKGLIEWVIADTK